MREGAPRSSRPVERISLALAILVVLLFPFVGLPRETERASLPLQLSYFYAADAALIALTLLSLPRLLAAARRPRGAEGATWLLLFALLAVAFLVHPSAWGVDVLLRILAAAALYRVVADLAPRERGLVAGALGFAAILQAPIALLQFVGRGPLGLQALGELGEDLISYGGGPPLARGTLGHEFILAGLALVSASVLLGEGLRSARPAPWLLSASLALVPVGFVYARTVSISVGLACASLVRPAFRSSRQRWALAALLVGAGVPALVASEGWAGSLARGLGSDRGAILMQALAIVADEPVFGVGPGGYLPALRERPELHVTRELQNVHNVPVMIAAEAGIPAAVAGGALLLLLGWRAFRAGAPALTLYLAYAPWFVLDVLPYVTPQGVVLTGLWVAFLRHAERPGPTGPPAERGPAGDHT